MASLQKSRYFYRIDLYRLLFTVFVAVIHFEHLYPFGKTKYFESLYRAVDFFFVLSGFLLFYSFKSKKYGSAFDFALSKLKRLLPVNVVVVLMTCLAAAFEPLVSVKSITAFAWKFVVNFLCAIPNLVFLQNFVPVYEHFLPYQSDWFAPLWYISAMLVSCFIWYWLLLKFQSREGENPKFHAWGLVLAALVFAYLVNACGQLNVTQGGTPVFKIPVGFLRGFAEIGIGVFCANYRLEIKNGIGKSLLKLLVPLVLAVLIFYAKGTAIDFVFVVFAAIALVFEFSLEDAPSPKLEKLCRFASKAASALYFSHAFVIVFEYTALLRGFPAVGANLAMDVAARAALLAATSVAVHWLSKPAAKLLQKLGSHICYIE